MATTARALIGRSVTRILGELWAKLELNEKASYTNLANEVSLSLCSSPSRSLCYLGLYSTKEHQKKAVLCRRSHWLTSVSVSLFAFPSPPKLSIATLVVPFSFARLRHRIDTVV